MAAATPSRDPQAGRAVPKFPPGKARKRSPRTGSCNFPATRGLRKAACGHRGDTLGTFLASRGVIIQQGPEWRRLLGDTNRGDRGVARNCCGLALAPTLALQVASSSSLSPHPCHPVPVTPPLQCPIPATLSQLLVPLLPSRPCGCPASCPCHPIPVTPPLQVPSVPSLPPYSLSHYCHPVPGGVQHSIPVTLFLQVARTPPLSPCPCHPIPRDGSGDPPAVPVPPEQGPGVPLGEDIGTQPPGDHPQALTGSRRTAWGHRGHCCHSQGMTPAAPWTQSQEIPFSHRGEPTQGCGQGHAALAARPGLPLVTNPRWKVTSDRSHNPDPAPSGIFLWDSPPLPVPALSAGMCSVGGTGGGNRSLLPGCAFSRSLSLSQP